MDYNNIGLGAGGGIAAILIVYFFNYLNTHRVRIISSCCSFTAEEDRTPKVILEPEKTVI
jgi:hypothetical protein